MSGTPAISAGKTTNHDIIQVITNIIMLSMIMAISLLSQWSCSNRSVPIFSKAVDVFVHFLELIWFFAE